MTHHLDFLVSWAAHKKASTDPAAAEGPSDQVFDLPQGVWTKHSECPSDAGPPTFFSRGFH